MKKAIIYYMCLSAGKIFFYFHCFGMSPPVIPFHPTLHLPGQKRNVWMKTEQKYLLSVSELVSGKPAEDFERELFSHLCSFVALAIESNEENLICCGRTVNS